MKESLIRVIQDAGQEILRLSKAIIMEYKKDKSPITEADKASHRLLRTQLKILYNVPVISEEECFPFEVRSKWSEFWLIDPLDGTKEFINGHDDFCVSIALIKDSQPILGLIYAPKLDELYYAQKNCGFEYRGIYRKKLLKSPIVSISRYHHSDATKKFIKLNNLTHTDTIGGALKFGRMALGLVDIYPRFEGSKEWDIAAGQIILEESRCKIIDLVTKEKPLFNKESMQNNYFLAIRPTLDCNKFRYGGLL